LIMSNQTKSWDVFISHASEDKDSFVRPLAVALRRLGVSIWYDEFSLRPGDSLSKSIDKGLSDSKFGLVVISPHFLKKPWPEYELRGLLSREIDEDRIILPVWHGVTRKQVLDFSPSLADKVALKTEGLSAKDVAMQILRQVRPDIHRKHPRAHLERIASGEALRELQEEIDRTRQELNEASEKLEEAREELCEYRCSFCGAPLSSRISVPVDPEEKDWDMLEEFECGCQTLGGFLRPHVERPCPADPRFPKFEDYKLHFRHNPEEPVYKWECYAMGKTEMSWKVHIRTGYGETREEAEQCVRDDYERRAKKRNT